MTELFKNPDSFPASLTPLAEATDASRVGNKAANLAAVMNWGLRVPNGWVLPNETLQAFVSQNQLGPVIEEARAAIQEGETEALQILSKQIRQRFLDAECSPNLRELLRTVQPISKTDLWVVRSSACGEDSGGAAFPGMLDSILHVDSPEALERAVKICWASCWSERCLHYQFARGVDPGGMGVILQQQVSAVISGVAFTRAPQVDWGDDLLVEACPGLANSLVSGEVTPHRFRINRTTARATRISEGEGELDLSPRQATALCDDTCILEAGFNRPQDIEWTMDAAHRLYIVQSRPITHTQTPPKEDVQIFSCANMNENYPDPVSPMLYEIAKIGYTNYFCNLGLRLGLSRVRIRAMQPMLQNIIARPTGRLYYNLSHIHGILHMAPGGTFLARAFDTFTGTAGDTQQDPAFTWKGFRKSRIGQAFEFGRIGLRSLYHLARLERGIHKFEAGVAAFAADSTSERLASLHEEELVKLLWRFLDIRANRWFYPSLADASSMVSYGLLKRKLTAAFPEAADQSIHNRLLQGLQDVISARPAIRLWEISRRIRSQSEAKKLFETFDSPTIWNALLRADPNSGLGELYTEVEDYLESWGFRRSGELMLTRPSFQEEPEALIEILRAYVHQEGAEQEARWQRQQTLGDQDTKDVLARLPGRGRFPRLSASRQRLFLRKLIRWTRRSISRRERARHKQALLYNRVRCIARTLGHKLTKQGFLPKVDDIFFLRIAELDSWLIDKSMSVEEIRQTVKTRAEEHAHSCTLHPPETLVLREGETWRPSIEDALPDFDPTSDTELSGTAACSGKATGPAAVLHDISEFDKLSDGCILVATQTDPGWGPAFFRIRGLIIERGGMLSHGAILAREYGIPTVVGVAQASYRIPHGQVVQVDGDEGMVRFKN